jgi:hypothetical protein
VEENQRANDKDGYALEAQSGKSQGRPPKKHALAADRPRPACPCAVLPESPCPDQPTVGSNPDGTLKNAFSCPDAATQRWSRPASLVGAFGRERSRESLRRCPRDDECRSRPAEGSPVSHLANLGHQVLAGRLRLAASARSIARTRRVRIRSSGAGRPATARGRFHADGQSWMPSDRPPALLLPDSLSHATA